MTNYFRNSVFDSNDFADTVTMPHVFRIIKPWWRSLNTSSVLEDFHFKVCGFTANQ